MTEFNNGDKDTEENKTRRRELLQMLGFWNVEFDFDMVDKEHKFFEYPFNFTQWSVLFFSSLCLYVKDFFNDDNQSINE